LALSTYALVSLDEAKGHLLVPGGAQDDYLERAINRASELIEQYLDRHIVTRGDLTEYHTLRSPTGAFLCKDTIRTLQRPIISVSSVHEDTAWPRTYGASSLLVVDVDYQVDKQRGTIRRLGSAGPVAWHTGHRGVRLISTCGYEDTAKVPERIKAVALRLVANIKGEVDRKTHGILAQSDSLGNFTRFGPATLTDDMKDDLAGELRTEVFGTGEAA